uniref:F-box domain-containing protein n=1 Tax=Mycena chlorophos TaxID=658473 RepID=A0ABQ0L5R3_MYCCL|nr:predicted protein [Mycena chlorophos]
MVDTRDEIADCKFANAMPFPCELESVRTTVAILEDACGPRLKPANPHRAIDGAAPSLPTTTSGNVGQTVLPPSRPSMVASLRPAPTQIATAPWRRPFPNRVFEYKGQIATLAATRPVYLESANMSAALTVPTVPTEHACLRTEDIFLAILHAFLDPVKDWSLDIVRRGTIRSVSRRWRDELDRHPTLWMRLFFSAHMGPDYVRFAFKRAEQTSKTVIASFATVSYSGNDVNARPSATTHLQPHAEFGDAFVEMLKMSAPTIRNLSIRVDDFVRWNTFVRLLDNTAFTALDTICVTLQPMATSPVQAASPLLVPATLRNLILNVSTPDCVCDYSNVAHLTLTGTAFLTSGTGTPGEEVIRALRHCLRLETLKLVNTDFEMDDALDTLTFPFLTDLSYTCKNIPGARGHVCGYLLSCLHTPNLVNLSLHISHRRGVKHFVPLNREKLSLATYVELSGSWGHFTAPWGTNVVSSLSAAAEVDLTRMGGFPTLVPDTGSDSSQELIRLLFDALSLPQLRTLRLPRSLSGYDVENLSITWAMLDSVFMMAPNHGLVVLEEHARCHRRFHYACRSYMIHRCPRTALPHESCATLQPVDVVNCRLEGTGAWTCTDRLHESCTRAWSRSENGSLRVAVVPSLDLRRVRRPSTQREYEHVFYDS